MTSNNKNEHGILRIALDAYGGFFALLKSYYLLASILITIITYNFWMTKEWWHQVISVTPGILGFTLGGFAVFLSFGDDKFKKIISGKIPNEEGESPYLEVSATFFYFISIQVISLIISVIANATNIQLPYNSLTFILHIIGNFIGYWTFIHGLCLVLAAALAIFRLSYWFDIFNSKIE